VAQEIAGDRATVRRWTGGGVVSHGEDLTYSIMIGSMDAAFALPSKMIYHRVHSAVSQALRKIGIEADIIEKQSAKISEACFANPVASDVIANGRKIAGAAHRKSGSGLLHQGSIQSPNLDERFRKVFAALLSSQITVAKTEEAVLDAAEELAANKYATTAWLHRR
jgi:lipoate-protein ligase A